MLCDSLIAKKKRRVDDHDVGNNPDVVSCYR